MRRLAALLALASSLATVVEAAGTWLRLTSPHFEMITSAGEKNAREAILSFETARQFLLDAGMGRRLPAKRVQIVAFRNEQEFRPYAPNDFASAFYSGGADRDYIVLSQTGAGSFPVAVHEYTHLLSRHITEHLPIWLNEGVAELFSTLRPDGSKVAVGDPIRSHVDRLRYNRLIDLPALFAVTRESPLYNERSRVDLFYAESWALVHMLYTSPQYRAKFRDFLEAAWSGEDSATAIRRIFGRTVTDVQKDLVSYVRDGPNRPLVVDVKLDRPSAEVDAGTLEDWDARLELAGILASSEHQTEAGRHMLEQLMAEQPQRPETPAMLADIALREGRRDDAIQLLAKAAELRAANPEIYFRYAMLRWNRSGDSDEAVRNALRRALELNPDYGDARIRLGLALMDMGDYRGALGELAKVKDVPAEGAFWYRHGIAYAHYRLGEYGEARGAIAAAETLAHDDAQRTAVAHLRGAIDTAESDARANAATIAETQFPVMRGTLRRLDCDGARIRLELLSEGHPVWFFIDNPAAVRMSNTGSVTVEFVCGEQPERHVEIEYLAHGDTASHTIGLVRGIRFE